MPKISRGSGTQHLRRASERYRQAVRRKLSAYKRHIQVGAIAQGSLQALAIQHPRLVWSSFGSWLRGRPAAPRIAVRLQLRGTDRVTEVSLTMPIRAQSYASHPLMPVFVMNLPEGYLLPGEVTFTL